MSAPRPPSYPPVNGTEPCFTGGDPDRFFRLSPGRPSTTPHPVAKECQGCHVLEQCLAYSLAHRVRGIWGGKTEAERRAIQKEQKIRPINLDSGIADSILIVRAHQRGMSNAAIAALVERHPNVVNQVLTQWRRHQRQQERAAS